MTLPVPRDFTKSSAAAASDHTARWVRIAEFILLLFLLVDLQHSGQLFADREFKYHCSEKVHLTNFNGQRRGGKDRGGSFFRNSRGTIVVQFRLLPLGRRRKQLYLCGSPCCTRMEDVIPGSDLFYFLGGRRPTAEFNSNFGREKSGVSGVSRRLVQDVAAAAT